MPLKEAFLSGIDFFIPTMSVVKMRSDLSHFLPDIVTIVTYQYRNHTIIAIVLRKEADTGVAALKIDVIFPVRIVNDPHTVAIVTFLGIGSIPTLLRKHPGTQFPGNKLSIKQIS